MTAKMRMAVELLKASSRGVGALESAPTQADGTFPVINWTTGRALERHGLAKIMAPTMPGWRHEIALTDAGTA